MRLYRLLLHVFPAPFRRRFGKEMAETFADRLREPGGWGGATWLRRGCVPFRTSWRMGWLSGD
jgi:hypothetical protein